MSTTRKMMVTAFNNIAKAEGWHDSKLSPVSLNNLRFRNTRAWARYITGLYNGCDVVAEIQEWAHDPNRLTQSDFDSWAQEEVWNW